MSSGIDVFLSLFLKSDMKSDLGCRKGTISFLDFLLLLLLNWSIPRAFPNGIRTLANVLARFSQRFSNNRTFVQSYVLKTYTQKKHYLYIVHVFFIFSWKLDYLFFIMATLYFTFLNTFAALLHFRRLFSFLAFQWEFPSFWVKTASIQVGEYRTVRRKWFPFLCLGNKPKCQIFITLPIWM